MIPSSGFKLLVWDWKGISEIGVGHDGDGAVDRCRGKEGQPFRAGGAPTLHVVPSVVMLTELGIEMSTKASAGMARRPVHNVLKVGKLHR